jgi:hypothetical protein
MNPIEQFSTPWREAIQSFAVEELVWDLGCNVPNYIRRALLDEFARRGISYADAQQVHGRGKRRGGRPW